MPITPLLPRVSVRAARRKLPVGLVAVIDAQLRGRNAGRSRSTRCSTRSSRSAREVGSPPLAAPIGQIIASQALVNVLGANRYATIVDELRDLVLGRFGRTPGPIDPALERAVELLDRPRRRGAGRHRGAARAGEGACRERGGAAPAGALRRRSRAAAPLDPPAHRRRGGARRRARAGARRADPRRSSGSSRRPASARSRSRRTACASGCAAPSMRRWRLRRRRRPRRAGAGAAPTEGLVRS